MVRRVHLAIGRERETRSRQSQPLLLETLAKQPARDLVENMERIRSLEEENAVLRRVLDDATGTSSQTARSRPGVESSESQVRFSLHATMCHELRRT